MTRRIVRVGSVKNGTAQLITTTYEESPDGTRECVTLETPPSMTDTQRLRLLSTWDTGKTWGPA